ncbi:MAG: DUF4105 domain-containing protein [Deltaproteobacteria bacterium]|nr:DUF4105 domain-containing protein [Deltaproteobacteria bacterium]
MNKFGYGYGRFSPISIFLYILIIVSLAAPSFADEKAYIDLLVKSAIDKKLHDKKYWKTLLHYKDTLFGIESLIDDPKFFIAENGKHNPKVELEKTIRVFFDANYKGKEIPVCKYMARFTWLKEQLLPDIDKIPLKECKKLSDFKLGDATIAFPTYYLNNPASMFGHTFLNLKTDYSTDLLSNAVNYAADVGSYNAFSYALSGVFGFFKGYYSILPYYKKISEYSDLDQRDIWEYKLNLNENEIRRMVYHIYELENIYSDYYFFDENCSYNILFLLEVARPTLDLTDKFSIAIIPIDTVKEMQKQGLIASSSFRPSNSSKIKHKASLLSDYEKEVALKVSKGEILPKYVLDLDISDDKKIILIDLVIEYSKYLLFKKKISQSKYKKIILPALRSRSKLGKVEKIDYQIKTPDDPINGHDAKRLLINSGTLDDNWFVDIGLRPSFADMLNSDYSKDAGVQLQFFNTKFRYYTEDEDFDLESFYLFDIASIAPRDSFFQPLSWKVNAGIYKKYMKAGRKNTVFLNFGGGVSYHWFPGLCYIMPEIEINTDDSLEKGYAIGYGSSIGIISNLSDSISSHLSGKILEYDLGEEHTEINATLLTNYKINNSNSIGFEVSYLKTYDVEYGQYMLKYHFFF